MGLVTPDELARYVARPHTRWPVAVPDQRWKREECTYVKHDKLFSDWKILVGPEDWKCHAAGKEDVERYRAHNLPGSNWGPGVYELGVTTPEWAAVNEQRVRLKKKERKLRPQDVMVVYVGNADHIRHRLQRYGEAGGHLEGSRSTRLFVIKDDGLRGSWKKCKLQNRGALVHEKAITDSEFKSSPDDGGGKFSRGPRLFSEVFALGCAIVFRWTATDSKSVAEKATAELLKVFDYAWNRGGNGSRRSREVLEKTLMRPPAARSRCHCFRTKRLTWLPFRVVRVGVNISARKPTESDQPEGRSSFLSRRKVGDFLMSFKSRPHLLPVLGRTAKSCEFTKLDIPIERCGALLYTGLPCNALPVRGRKRCLMLKDLKSTKRRGSKQGHAAAAITSQQIRNYQHLGSRQHSAGRHTRKECKATTHEAATHNNPSDVNMDPNQRSLTISCLPSFLLLAGMMKHECKTQEVKPRMSLSFNTWLKTSRGMMTETEITAAADAPAAAAIRLKTAATDHTNNIFSKVDLESLQNEDLFEIIVHNIYGSSRCVPPIITHTMMQRNCPSHYAMHAEIGI